MSTDEQTDSMAAGSDVSPDDSKLSLTVDKTRLEHHAEHRDLAMQEGPLGSEGDALVHGHSHSAGAKTNGHDNKEPLLVTRSDKTQDGQYRLPVSFRSSLISDCASHHADSASPVLITTTQPLVLNYTMRGAGNASTPNLKTTLNASDPPQTTSPAANNPPQDTAPKLSTSRNPPPVPTKPRGDIRDRSSSYGASLSFQSTPSGSAFTNPDISRSKGQASAYGSVKSSKEDGFKVS
jgi:hypothetical protein